MVQTVRDLPVPPVYCHCIKRVYFFSGFYAMAKHFRHRAQPYSGQKKIAFANPLFSAYSTNISPLSLRTKRSEVKQSHNERSEIVPPAENPTTKHFLSALHTAVFAAAFSVSFPNAVSRLVCVSNPTIFLRVGFPSLPTLSQVPPVYSRLSLHGL